MPNCDFYAVGDDTRLILDFVFEQPGWTLYELASRNDERLRSFSSSREVARAFDVGGANLYFHLYAPAMGGKVYESKVVFERGAVPGAKYRYDSRGWGLIQLYFSAPRDGRLAASHTNHNSETRARRWEPTYEDEPDRVDDWDWKAVTQISSHLNRFIRKLAVSKSGSRPVLPGAQAGSESEAFRLSK